MISRFTRTFVFSCIALLLIGTLFFLNPPIHLQWDGDNNEWFNTDGVPHVPATVDRHASSGNVIMGKLGNATAK